MKFGTVAIVGRSNVGKSTLLNRLLNEKIAIVSEKPQTTRTRILGVVHAPGAQIALLDTPGLHKPQHLLNRRMVRTAVETLEEAGLREIFLPALKRQGDGRLWRSVPNRRWYNDQRGETPASQEVVLIHRKARGAP